MNKVTNEHLLKDIQFSFIELPKFMKEMHQLDMPIDKWTFFIKNSEELHVIPDFANEDEGLKTAFIEADKYQWSKEELKAYDNVTIKEQDERGEREIIAQKARDTREIEAVVGLHQNGVPLAIIAKSLNISEEQVLQIIGNQANK
jgi:predicted transposase/invertase (TIGR01784 family)